MQADRAGQPSAGILIALDALIVQRADQPSAIDEAPVALRRIGWIGRPIILVGTQVAGRDLPEGRASAKRGCEPPSAAGRMRSSRSRIRPDRSAPARRPGRRSRHGAGSGKPRAATGS